MLVTVSGMFTSSSLSHLSNRAVSILVSPSGRCSFLSPEHVENALLPSVVTVFGMFASKRLSHELNALSPIVSSLLLKLQILKRGIHRQL